MEDVEMSDILSEEQMDVLMLKMHTGQLDSELRHSTVLSPPPTPKLALLSSTTSITIPNNPPTPIAQVDLGNKQEIDSPGSTALEALLSPKAPGSWPPAGPSRANTDEMELDHQLMITPVKAGPAEGRPARGGGERAKFRHSLPADLDLVLSVLEASDSLKPATTTTNDAVGALSYTKGGRGAQAPSGPVRYWDDSVTQLQCWRCGQTGHLSSYCTDPVERRPCFICGETSHPRQTCPNTLCLRCFAPGHKARDCTLSIAGAANSKKFSPIECFRCGRSGHLARYCESVQRARGKRLTCYNCGAVGHDGPDCQKPSAQYQSQNNNADDIRELTHAHQRGMMAKAQALHVEAAKVQRMESRGSRSHNGGRGRDEESRRGWRDHGDDRRRGGDRRDWSDEREERRRGGDKRDRKHRRRDYRDEEDEADEARRDDRRRGGDRRDRSDEREERRSGGDKRDPRHHQREDIAQEDEADEDRPPRQSRREELQRRRELEQLLRDAVEAEQSALQEAEQETREAFSAQAERGVDSTPKASSHKNNKPKAPTKPDQVVIDVDGEGEEVVEVPPPAQKSKRKHSPRNKESNPKRAKTQE